MKPIEIKKNIYWVGALDWNLRDFHGYALNKGTTYNAFLVKDEKIALFDTVKAGFKSDLIHNLYQIVDPTKIDYIIINHVEMDHSGSLPAMVELIKPEKIFCSAMGKKAIIEHFHCEDWPLEVVNTGDSISLGTKTVHFIETRMLHWPDSMFSYLAEDKMLISSDAFGEHWCTSERFDDQVDNAELMAHAEKYYANILLPFSPLVQKLLAKVVEMGIEIDTIAPDHGVVWRKNVPAILAAYDRWSRQETRDKAVIIYDTMWESTEKMAKAIGRTLMQEGISVKMMNMHADHRSDVATEILDAKAILFGSATLNNGILPCMADIICYLKGLKPRGRVGAAFGSYGWSGEAVGILNQALQEMKVELVSEGVKIKNVPTHDSLKACVELGLLIAKAVKSPKLKAES